MSDKEKSATVIEEKKEFGQELRLADKLAIERTVMSADRTMLAGVRTSMSFIGFGFTIFNILRYMQEHAPLKFMRPQTPRTFNFHARCRNRPAAFHDDSVFPTLKRLVKNEIVIRNPNFRMAAIILLLGFIFLLSILANIVLL